MNANLVKITSLSAKHRFELNMNQFCQNLPKIELHAHLNGSLSTKTLTTLGSFNESIERYQKLNGLLQRDSRTLEECFHLFKVAHDATNTKQALYKATRDVIKEFHSDNVIYLELRTTPRATEEMTQKEYVETVIKVIEDNRDNIIVKLLLSIDRRHDLSVSKNVMELIIKMKNKYPQIVKGVDLCGNPNVGIFNCNLFQKARTNGLKLSLHCAEVKSDEEVKNVFNFKPDRIGHGTCIHPNFGGSEDLWEIYIKNKIPIEMCMTSNVICGTSKSYKEHHISEWIKNDLPMTLSTDDKGVFNTTLTKEYQLLQEHFNLSETDLWRMSFNSIDQSFCDDEEKDYLKTIMLNWKSKNIK